MREIDWTALVRTLLDDLVLSQGELAERCEVAQQAVSNWKMGTRRPGYRARRKLMEAARESGIDLERYFTKGMASVVVREERVGLEQGAEELADDYPQELTAIYQRLSKKGREEFLRFARFLAANKGG